MRILKAVTVYAFLVLITTAWVLKFSADGYTRTLDSLRASFGDLAYVFIAILSVAIIVSTPLIGIAGIIGIVLSRRLGRSAFGCGLLCCVLSFANFVLLKNYGGAPGPNSDGITPVERRSHP